MINNESRSQYFKFHYTFCLVRVFCTLMPVSTTHYDLDILLLMFFLPWRSNLCKVRTVRCLTLTLCQVSTLVCNLGGLLGLFVGFSVMTLFEFFDVGFDMLAIACSKLRQRGQVGRNSVGDVDGHGLRMEVPQAWGPHRTRLTKNSKPTLNNDNGGTPPPGYYMD